MSQTTIGSPHLHEIFPDPLACARILPENESSEPKIQENFFTLCIDLTGVMKGIRRNIAYELGLERKRSDRYARNPFEPYSTLQDYAIK